MLTDRLPRAVPALREAERLRWEAEVLQVHGQLAYNHITYYTNYNKII